MNAYLFTGWISQFHNGHFADSCASLIIYGGDEEASWNYYHECQTQLNHGDHPIPTKIEKVVGAPLFGQLFTETSRIPIDWDQIVEQARLDLESTVADELGQGYWVDCNACLDLQNLSPDLQSLEQALPEDIRSGLNWQTDKSYFFVVSVLSPPPPPPNFDESFEPDEASQAQELEGGEEHDGFAKDDMDQRQSAFPELAVKELAVLVRARNSVVAAWLWRKYALDTPLVQNAILVTAWTGAIKCGSELNAAEKGT